MSANVVALVTLYYPDAGVASNIEVLAEQVSNVIILDNTPDCDNSDLFSGIQRCKYFANGHNFGLSVAFNKGLALEVSRLSDYIIFFDQDSHISDGLIAGLIDDFESVSKKKKIGCIGPLYHDIVSGERSLPNDRFAIDAGLYGVKNVITSSMLTKYTILQEVGFWNEKIFLDLADWDLCWRLRSRGFLICLTSNLSFNHTLGSGIKKIFFLKVRQSQPVRQYYGVRDSLKLFLLEYVPFKYRVRFFFMWTLSPLFYIVFFPNRFVRLKYVARAFIDAFRGVDGPFRNRNSG